MKRKYYMRGLGVGIIVTSLILMLGLFFSGLPMTDAAVKRRARALGMVEANEASGDASSRTLKELQEEQEKKAGSDAKVKTTTTTNSDGDVTTVTEKEADPLEKKKDGKNSSTDASSKENSSDSKSESSSSKKSSDTEKAKESTTSKKNTEDSGQKNISITITGGDSSLSVGKKLQSAGLVSSASAFDDYLEQNGYDHVIRTGTFSIAQGSSYRDIAREITGR